MIRYVVISMLVEWTSTITKYLKDQLNKLNDYQPSYARMSTETEIPQKQWHYTVRLTDWLYEVRILIINKFPIFSVPPNNNPHDDIHFVMTDPVLDSP